MQHPVPKLKDLKISGETLYLEYLLNCDFDNVAEAAQSLPAAICWLGTQRGVQYQRVEACKRYVKEAEARAYFSLKGGQFEAQGYGTKPTEVAIKHAVSLDEDVQTASVTLEKAQRFLIVYTTQIDALRGKLEMTRTSEATRRRLIPDDNAVKWASQTNQDQEEED